MGTSTRLGIPYKEFESVTAKNHHAFTPVLARARLLSPCNKILVTKPTRVLLHQNKILLTAISDICTLLKESIAALTLCKEITSGWPDYIGRTHASSLGFEGIIIGEHKTFLPAVFWGEWPPETWKNLQTIQNLMGSLSILDLEIAELLLLWFVMEAMCPTLKGAKAPLSVITPRLSLGLTNWLQNDLLLECHSSGLSPSYSSFTNTYSTLRENKTQWQTLLHNCLENQKTGTETMNHCIILPSLYWQIYIQRFTKQTKTNCPV